MQAAVADFAVQGVEQDNQEIHIGKDCNILCPQYSSNQFMQKKVLYKRNCSVCIINTLI